MQLSKVMSRNRLRQFVERFVSRAFLRISPGLSQDISQTIDQDQGLLWNLQQKSSNDTDRCFREDLPEISSKRSTKDSSRYSVKISFKGFFRISTDDFSREPFWMLTEYFLLGFILKGSRFFFKFLRKFPQKIFIKLSIHFFEEFTKNKVYVLQIAIIEWSNKLVFIRGFSQNLEIIPRIFLRIPL